MEDKSRRILQLIGYLCAETCIVSVFIHLLGNENERIEVLGYIMLFFNAHTRIVFFLVPEAKYLIAAYTHLLIEAIVLAAGVIGLLLCTFAKGHVVHAIEYLPVGVLCLYMIQVAGIIRAFVSIIFNDKIDLLIPEEVCCAQPNLA